jgi:hypothetical protein
MTFGVILFIFGISAIFAFILSIAFGLFLDINPDDLYKTTTPLFVIITIASFIISDLFIRLNDKEKEKKVIVIKYVELQKEMSSLQKAAQDAGLGYFQDEYTVTSRHFIIATSPAQIPAESTK